MGDVLYPKPLAWADEAQLREHMMDLVYHFLDLTKDKPVCLSPMTQEETSEHG